MKAKIYIETSVVSYLTSRPSHDLITRKSGYEACTICTPEELMGI